MLPKWTSAMTVIQNQRWVLQVCDTAFPALIGPELSNSTLRPTQYVSVVFFISDILIIHEIQHITKDLTPLETMQMLSHISMLDMSPVLIVDGKWEFSATWSYISKKALYVKWLFYALWLMFLDDLWKFDVSGWLWILSVGIWYNLT